NWEALHPAIENAVVRPGRRRQILDQSFAVETRGLSLILDVTEHGEQTFLAIDNVLGAGESFSRKKRAFGTHSSGPRINRVLHVGQLACGDGAWAKCSRRADTNSRHHLFRRKIEHATCRYRSGEGA